MQFIDQSRNFASKSLSVQEAIISGRARIDAKPGIENLIACFVPDLASADAFDRRIDTRVDFFGLSPAAQLDLLISDLLPQIFHADAMRGGALDTWTVRIVIDGETVRVLRFDGTGLSAVSVETAADATIETDMVTGLAMLRWCIAQYHRTGSLLMAPGAMTFELTDDAAAAVVGGMPSPDPEFDENDGDEDDEGDEGNEEDEEDEGNESDEGDEDDENDESNEDNEGNEAEDGDEGEESIYGKEVEEVEEEIKVKEEITEVEQVARRYSSLL